MTHTYIFIIIKNKITKCLKGNPIFVTQREGQKHCDVIEKMYTIINLPRTLLGGV